MHIAFLTPEYPTSFTTPSGGLGTSIKNLAEALSEEGIKVSVVIYGQEETKVYKENNLLLYLVKKKKFKFLGWFFYRKHLQKFLNNLIREKRIDVVEAPDWTGITAFIKLKCPLVIRLNGTDGYFCYLEGRKQKWKNRFFEKKALLSSDAIVSVSSYTAEISSQVFNLQNNIPVIPNSIKVENFRPQEILQSRKQILYFGTLIRKKGVLELAGIFNEIFRKDPEVKLLLIGKDVVDIFEKRSTFQMFYERLEVAARENVKYLPEVPYEEVKKYLATSEVVLLPSFAEALPMTWIEAMAMEKAIVSSNIGWAKEVLVDGRHGLTELPTAHLLYAEKVIRLLNNRKLQKELGRAAREQVIKKFSAKVVASKNISFYKSLISKC